MPLGLGDLWVLRPSAAAGPLARHAREVTRRPTVAGVVLSPTGAVALAVTAVHRPATDRWQLTVAADQTSTGRLIRVLHRFAPLRTYLPTVVSLSASGRYLLINEPGLGLRQLDVTTGAMTAIPVPAGPGRPDSIAW